jgi:DNA-binding NtrC family response regulator
LDPASRLAHDRGEDRPPALLVVDDEIPVLKVLERLAARIGFDVVACASGAEAMRTLSRGPADLAMVDLRMPDVNGLDLLRQIRTTVPGCEVILMTAYAAVDSAVDAIKLGAREYLTKPFDFDRLKQVLEDIRAELDGNRMAAAKVLGISRRALCRRLDRHHLADEAPPPAARRVS